jgi:hypothetical protein
MVGRSLICHAEEFTLLSPLEKCVESVSAASCARSIGSSSVSCAE